MTKTQTQRDEMAIAEREYQVGRMLEDAGLSRTFSATATTPAEEGMYARYNAETGQIEIQDSREVYSSFDLDAVEEVEAWIAEREAYSMVW